MFNKKRIVIFVVFIALMFFLTTFAGEPAQIAKVATRDVIFTDSFDGINISEQKVIVGTSANVPDTPKHQNVVFTGWYDYFDHNTTVTNFDRIMEDTHVVALYKPDINNNGIPDDEDRYYNVTFVDGVNNKELKKEKVLEGLDATAPRELNHPNYEFLGWDGDYADVRSDLTVTSTYRFTGNNNNNNDPAEDPVPEVKKYTVTFVDGDDNNKVIAKVTVAEGKSATAPTPPTHTDRLFLEWDGKYTNVKSNTTVTAVYTDNKNHNEEYDFNEEHVTITFASTGNGSLKGETVYEGILVELTFEEAGIEIPEAVPKNDYYKALDWDPTIETTVHGAADYMIEFVPINDKYSENGGPDGTADEEHDYKLIIKHVFDDGKVTLADSVYERTYDNRDYDIEIEPVEFYDNEPAKVTGTIGEPDKKTTNIETVNYTRKTFHVKFLDEDGTVLKEEDVLAEEAATAPAEPTKEGNAQYTYTFKEWDTDYSKIVEDTTVKAVYESTVNEYTIIWADEDGTPLETDSNVPYGTTPEYNGEVPTKESTAEFTYGFGGWSPEVKAVDGDKTYTATYTNTTNKYTVTWKNADGTVLETDSNVEYGTTPKYDGETPIKEGNVQYSYTFKGWDKELSAVVGDVTYTATFTESVNQYTVTWKNADGTVLETDENVSYGTLPTYNGATPTKAKTEQYTYTFDKWSPEVEEVKGDVTYTATFTETVNKYKVTFVDEDGTVLKAAIEYAYGTKAADIAKPADPTKEATAQYTYTFNGWSPEIAEVTEEVTYKATYKETLRSYTVTWKNADGTVLEKDENVEYGTTPKYDGATPTKESTVSTVYTFAGWDEEITAVEGNVTYTATYTEAVRTYQVTFVDYDGKVLKAAQTVEYNKAATAPADPSRTNWTFTGWDQSFTNVKSDLTVKATYKANQIGIKVVEKPNVNWVFQKGTTVDLKTLIDVYEVYADGSEKETTNYTDDFSTNRKPGEYTLKVTENGFNDTSITYKVQNEEAAQTKFEVRMSVQNSYKHSKKDCEKNCTSDSNTVTITKDYNFLEVIEHYDEYITVNKIRVKYKNGTEEELNFSDTVRWSRIECTKTNWLGQCTNSSIYDPVRIASSKRMTNNDRTDLFTQHQVDHNKRYPDGALSTKNAPVSGKCSTWGGCTYMLPASLPLSTTGVTYYEVNNDLDGFINVTNTKVPYDVQDDAHQIDTVTITYYRQSDDSSIAGDYEVVFRYTPNAEKEFTAIDEYKI